MIILSARYLSRGDHPREYGENIEDWSIFCVNRGSSPRIRGESAASWAKDEGDGIIPANTGRIPRGRVVRCCGWDHPREYGENVASHDETP